MKTAEPNPRQPQSQANANKVHGNGISMPAVGALCQLVAGSPLQFSGFQQVIQAKWEKLPGLGDIGPESSTEDVALAIARLINAVGNEGEIKNAIDQFGGDLSLSDLSAQLNMDGNPQIAVKLRKSQWYKDFNPPVPLLQPEQRHEEEKEFIAPPQMNPVAAEMNKLDYVYIKKLGEGGLGSVHLLRKGAEKFAVKHVSEGASAAKAEYDILRQIDHPAIPKVFRLHLQFIIFEYVEGMDMKSFIPTGIGLALEAGIEVARIVEFLHERAEVTHGDIKPANIMIDAKGNYKLIDFGEAKELPVNKQTAKERIQSDIGMIARLVKRLIMCNEVTGGEKRPKHVSPELFGFLDAASAGEFQTLAEFQNELNALNRTAPIYESIIQETIQIYGGANEVDEGDMAQKIQQRLQAVPPEFDFYT